MRHVLAALVLASSFGLTAAGAQTTPADDCPDGYSCIDYAGTTLEMSDDDVVVLFVTAVSTVTTEDANGVATACTFRGAVAARPGGRPQVVAEVQEPCAGRFDGVQFGDVFALDAVPVNAPADAPEVDVRG